MDSQQQFVLFLTLLWMPSRAQNSSSASVLSSYEASWPPVLSPSNPCTATGERTTAGCFPHSSAESREYSSLISRHLTILGTTALRNESASLTGTASSQRRYISTKHSTISLIAAFSRSLESKGTYSSSFLLSIGASFNSSAIRASSTLVNAISSTKSSSGTTGIGSSAHQDGSTSDTVLSTTKSSRGITSIVSSARISSNASHNISTTTKSSSWTASIDSSAGQASTTSVSVTAATGSSDLEPSSPQMTSSYTEQETTPSSSATTFQTTVLNATSVSSISSQSISATKSLPTSSTTSKPCWGQTDQECNSSSKVQIINIAWYYGIVCTLALCFGQTF